MLIIFFETKLKMLSNTRIHSQNKIIFHNILFILLILFCYSSQAFAEKHYTKLWTQLTIQGSFCSNKNIEYLVDGQLRFFKQNDFLEDGLTEVGLGYKLLPTLSVMMGSKYVFRNHGVNETRIWQQGTIVFIDKTHFKLTSRSMLEEQQIAILKPPLLRHGIGIKIFERFMQSCLLDNTIQIALFLMIQTTVKCFKSRLL
jgi:hypothetical protein